MNKLAIILLVILSAILTAFVFMNNNSGQSNTQPNTNHVNPQKDAEHDIQNNSIKLLTHGHPMPAEVSKIRDQAAQKIGIRYQSKAGCVVNEATQQYVQQYNQAVREHLNQQFGHNWEDCLNLAIHQQQAEAYANYEVEEIANQYIMLPFDLYFDLHQDKVSPQDLHLLEANAKGFATALELIGHDHKIYLKAFYNKKEDQSVAEMRLKKLIAHLNALGISENYLKIVGIEEGQVPNCQNCPFDFSNYPQRVELRFEAEAFQNHP